MIKVYQTIVDKGHGNCMQAAIASLFELPLEQVPNFIELGDKWFSEMYNFCKSQGYTINGTLYNYNRYRIINKKTGHTTAPFKTRFCNLKKMEGVRGYFYASVYSPKYYNPNENPATTHAVIIDKNLNIVHDVNPNYSENIVYPETKKLKYNGILDVYMINPISN